MTTEICNFKITVIEMIIFVQNNVSDLFDLTYCTFEAARETVTMITIGAQIVIVIEKVYPLVLFESCSNQTLSGSAKNS